MLSELLSLVNHTLEGNASAGTSSGPCGIAVAKHHELLAGVELIEQVRGLDLRPGFCGWAPEQ